MMVSAPHRVAHTILSTSSPIDEVTAELPILALTFTQNALPMIIGSALEVVVVGGMTARPRATSSRTSSGGNPSRLSDIRHLGGDLPGAGPLQLGAAIFVHIPARGARPAFRSITASVIGVRTRGVIQVKMFGVGEVHPAERHPQRRAVMVDLAIDLRCFR